jgi:hypothetical protein
MPDDANIQLLLAKLPANGLARKLVAPFAQGALDKAATAAQSVVAALKDEHLKEYADGQAEAA